VSSISLAIQSRIHRAAVLVLVLALVALIGGCGASKPSLKQATLVLDFTPNAVHAGIYSALARGYASDEGVDLHVEQPSESTDSVKLLLGGRTNFAILDIHDLAIARAEGQDIVGVMALVQKPLAAVIAQPSIHSPRQLQGRTVGVTGLSSDEAVLRSVLAGAGANPGRVKRVNIGFQAVPSLLAGRVSAVTAFWDVEGVELTHAHPGTREFRVNEYGAPSYPELVLCVTGSEIRQHPALVRHVVHAIQRGYAAAINDPAGSVRDLVGQVPGLDRTEVSEQMRALYGAFLGDASRFGELNLPRLRTWAAWEARFGIVKQPPDVSAMFDPSFAG
jgi:ABC-type nitrate/sulfonate/bicarbonate transport system substrate-binding protein